MLRVLTPLLLIIIFLSFVRIFDGKTDPIDNYPFWLKDTSGNRTDQTSGIYYLGKETGGKIFLTCDDIGVINRIFMPDDNDPNGIRIQHITLSDNVKEYLKEYKKLDFEEIVVDTKNNKILLSIEGFSFQNGEPLMYKKFEGLYELTYNNDLLSFDTITSINKIELPSEVFEHTRDNIGFEGIGITDNYLFLGLENYQPEGKPEFTDSTYIYIYNRQTKEIKTIPTKKYGIATICGLYAANDNELYGIDRNARKMFYLKLNNDMSIARAELTEMGLSIPGHPDINQIIGTSPESITMDAEGKIYAIVDPWKDMYKPDLEDRKKLSKTELEYFEKFMPMIYKYNNPFK